MYQYILWITCLCLHFLAIYIGALQFTKHLLHDPTCLTTDIVQFTIDYNQDFIKPNLARCDMQWNCSYHTVCRGLKSPLVEITLVMSFFICFKEENMSPMVCVCLQCFNLFVFKVTPPSLSLPRAHYNAENLLHVAEAGHTNQLKIDCRGGHPQMASKRTSF